MGEGDEVSDACRESTGGKSCSAARHPYGPFHRFVDHRLDTFVNMVGTSTDKDRKERIRNRSNEHEETPDEELRQFEKERKEARNPDHPGEQMSGTL